MKIINAATIAAFLCSAMTGYVDAKNLDILKPATAKQVAAGSSYLKEADLTDGRYFIRIDLQVIKTLEMGDSFKMVFGVDQKSYSGTVKNISSFEGMRRLTGNFIEEKSSQGGQFSMTLSADGSYVAGNFFTNKNSYTLEAKNGMGWINNGKNEIDKLRHD